VAQLGNGLSTLTPVGFPRISLKVGSVVVGVTRLDCYLIGPACGRFSAFGINRHVSRQRRRDAGRAEQQSRQIRHDWARIGKLQAA
jgi:hypothetical protein